MSNTNHNWAMSFRCTRNFSLIVVILLWSITTWNVAHAEITTSIDFARPKLQWAQLKTSTLRMMVKRDGYKKSLLPTAEIMQAIARGHSSFISVSHKLPKPDDEKKIPNDFSTVTAETYHDVHFAVDFKQKINIYSLDEEHHAFAIKDIEDDYLLHCPAHSRLHANIGDIFAASEYGTPIHSRNGVTNNLDLYMQSSEIARHEGFKVLRRVVAKSTIVSKHEGHCMGYETEDIHPFEMFEHLNVYGNVTRRFSRQYADRPVISEKRRLSIRDTGVLNCSDPFWKKGTTTYVDDDALVVKGTTFVPSVCVDYTNNLGSIAMNYDFNANAAVVKDITITSGVVCHNCYAFVGAQLRFNVQYSWTLGFGFYAGLSGGAGFNVDLRINNPTISGSVTKTLASPAAKYTPIVSIAGIVLSDRFGGLSLTLSGSGSATGSAQFTAGASIYAALWAYYWSSKADLKAVVSVTPPFAAFTYTNFKIQSLVVTAQLTGKVDMKVSYGSFATLSEDNTVNFLPYLQYAYNSEPSIPANRAVDNSGTSSTRAPAPIVLAPGGVLKYDHDYTTYTGNQELVAYYSISNGVNKYPIMQQSVTTLVTGHVKLCLEWIVPWDIRFLDSNKTEWKVNVRVTDMLLEDEIVSRETFVFRTSVPLLDWPAQVQGASFVVIPNMNYEIYWNASLLSYYDITNPFFGAGETRETKNVSFFVYPTQCNGSACIQQKVSLVTNAVNNGVVSLSFPSGVLDSGVAYYLTIESMECGTCKGWSNSVFHISAVEDEGGLVQVSSTIDSPIRVFQMVTTVDLDKSRNGPSKDHLDGMKSLNRKLGTCSGVASVTTNYGMQGSGTASISAFSYTLGTVSMNPFDLVTPTSSCQTDPNLLTPEPTQVPTQNPTLVPTQKPTLVPTQVPSKPTQVPSVFPTQVPTQVPTSGPPTQTTSSASSTGLSTAAIGGIAGGGAVVAIAAGVVLARTFFFRRQAARDVTPEVQVVPV